MSDDPGVPARPSWMRRAVVVAITVLVLLIVAGIAIGIVLVIVDGGDEGDGGDGGGGGDARSDVAAAVCRTDELGYMVADITVTNSSSERSNYSVDVLFTAPDGSRLILVPLPVEDVDPEQSVTTLAQSFTQPPPEGFSCRVTGAERIPDV